MLEVGQPVGHAVEPQGGERVVQVELEGGGLGGEASHRGGVIPGGEVEGREEPRTQQLIRN